MADRVAAITGSARGIGKNIARVLGAEGARVIICDVDEKSANATREELREQGLSAESLNVDLSRKGAPQSMIRQIIQQWGRLDILVNSARSGQRLGLLEEDEESWEQGMLVTLRAAFFASQEAIRVMSQKGGGSIVNVGSVAADLVCHESPCYHIAKAGLIQMTRYLAVHAGTYGVRVNAVSPGFIVQDEHRARYDREDNRAYREMAEFSHPVGHTGESDDVANAILFLCSPEASFISGQILTVDGGSTIQEQSTLISRFNNKKH